jgi:hypothetical protein
MFEAIFPPNNTVSAVNPPQLEPPDLFSERSILSRLTPLAFITDFDFGLGLPPMAGATVLDDTSANSFFYAVVTGDRGERGDKGERGDRVRPEKLVLFFDYPPQTQATFSRNQDIGEITLQLVRLDIDGIERSVMTTLQIRAACADDFAHDSRCLTATAKGAFLPNGPLETHSAAEVGITFSAHYGPSPNAKFAHAIYEVQAPLLVRLANDPAYFGEKVEVRGFPLSAPVGSPTGINQISGVPTAFDHDVLGFLPAFLGGARLGIAPGAPQVDVHSASISLYEASFSSNGDGVEHTAVGTYLAIGTSGATVSHVPRACKNTPSHGPVPFACDVPPE